MDPNTAPILLPSSPNSEFFPDAPIQSIEDDFSDSVPSGSGRNSRGGSDGIFDRHQLRSPMAGSESEYEDEDDLISEMPFDSQAPSCIAPEDFVGSQQRQIDYIPYTPPKSRSPFRNPSSVRGMQLETTPPHLRSPGISPHKHTHVPRLSNGSRNSTPRSTRSYHSGIRTGSPTKSKTIVKKENPLVLLHVTILPIFCPYSTTTLEGVAPDYVLQNWNLLKEKVSDTVLERGILIPHPQEEYELLEERLLESLELATPRILKCGHYHNDMNEAESCSLHDHENDENEEIYDEIADSDICDDCGRRVRDGTKGATGTGTRRWDIKIYASNGLMRAGAWAAAWREMERVDIEICPWMEDSLRRELDLRKIQEEEEAKAAVFARAQSPPSPSTMDEARRREIYGEETSPTAEEVEKAQAYIDNYANEYNNSVPQPQAVPEMQEEKPHVQPSFHHYQQTPQQHNHHAHRSVEVPISELLSNYVQLLLQDRKNIALAALSIIVVFLATRSTNPSPDITVSIPPVTNIPEAIPVYSAQIVPSAPSQEVNQAIRHQQAPPVVASYAQASIQPQSNAIKEMPPVQPVIQSVPVNAPIAAGSAPEAPEPAKQNLPVLDAEQPTIEQTQ
jgi:hypothetical protein